MEQRQTVMWELARRGAFCKKFRVRYVDGDWPYLEIEQPAGIARLIGEIKRLPGIGRVFLRGQTDHYNVMLPSLFRTSEVGTENLLAAERDFTERVSQEIPVKRLQCPHLPALLQHYGFRTSWLDVVDNLFIASWFATTELRRASDSFTEVVKSTKTHGWLFLIATNVDANELTDLDLRLTSHPLSTRPHVQHRISLQDPNIRGRHDLRDFVVGSVRIPVDEYTTLGTLFASSFLFPGPEADHTLRLLVEHHIDDIAVDVEQAHKLSSGTLGRTLRVRRI